MPRTRIKICGISNLDTARACVDAGADAIGLVFVSKSPRCVDNLTASRIADALPAFVEPVGLFCNHSSVAVSRTARGCGLRTVQLHGREDPDQVRDLGAFLRVIKALPFDPETAPVHLRDYRHTGAAALLWDTPPAPDAALTGGSGHAFDWQSFAEFTRAHRRPADPPFILAGGLDADNVGDAIRATAPYAVDTSSGVESIPGIKDLRKLEAFCAAVQSGQSHPGR